LSATVELLACVTCGGNERDALGQTRGERLLRQLEVAHVAPRADGALRDGAATSAIEPGSPHAGHDAVTLSSVRCLWACKRSCAVHLRSPGRPGYVLVELEPTAETAHALLDYATMLADSADGSVPFKQWPQPLRGHFLCRLPPSSPSIAAAPDDLRDRNQVP